MTPRRLPILCLALPALLAACSGTPDLGPPPGDPNAPYPALVPLDGDLTPDAVEDEPDDVAQLDARRRALEARAAALRPPVLSPEDDARLGRGGSQ